MWSEQLGIPPQADALVGRDAGQHWAWYVRAAA